MEERALAEPLQNHWSWVRRFDPRVQAAVDWVATLFSPQTRSRGFTRGYYDYLWTLDEIVKTIGDPKGLRVVDVGCGASVMGLALHHLGAEITALDRFEEYSDDYDNQMGTAGDMLSRLSEHRIDVCAADFLATQFPVQPESADIILFLAVIEHLPESPQRLLREFHRALRPGGWLVLTTPNHAWIRTRMRLLLGRSANHPLAEWWQTPFFGHVREYTTDEIRLMLEWSAFSVEKLERSSWQHLASRIPGRGGEPERWTTRFTLNSPSRVGVAGAALLTALVPSLRYSTLAIARKPATS